MPDTPQGSAIFELISQSGVRRDGTDLDSQFWSDAQWVRFQRGRPRKMGGYRMLSDQLYGPVRATHVDSRSAGTTVHSFSQWGVEQLLVDQSGAEVGQFNRTPSGFVQNALYTWQTGAMFQSGGSGTPLVIASAAPDANNIASDTTGTLCFGDVTSSAALTTMSDGSGPIAVSGGCCVLQPFLFVYGSNGLIRNSNPNDVSTATGWTTGGANRASTANVSGSKIVKGLPMRGGGQSPAGLFWSLESLIRVSYVGGATLWNYDTLSDDTTVLSKSGIVEYDNAYFWVGVDRFYVFTGVVQELPNDMNLNWFFDNLNFAARQKVWALKVPRFGEIWWFFPSGNSTECNAAVIFNVREKTWYDTRILRSAGSPARTYAKPVMTETQSALTLAVPYTPTGGMFVVGQNIVGSSSLASGTVVKVTDTQLNLTNVVGSFYLSEGIQAWPVNALIPLPLLLDTGTISAAPFSQALSTLWEHESGVDAVSRQTTAAIECFMETTNITWLTGSPSASQGQGFNYQMRLTRVEPDFLMSGTMTLSINGRGYAQGSVTAGDPVTFDGTTQFIDMREMRRELSLRFSCSGQGSTFQAGRILITAEPGDERG
jgi:hypothetical protein